MSVLSGAGRYGSSRRSRCGPRRVRPLTRCRFFHVAPVSSCRSRLRMEPTTKPVVMGRRCKPGRIAFTELPLRVAQPYGSVLDGMFPKIQRLAVRLGAEISFEDEVRLSVRSGRTLQPQGPAPGSSSGQGPGRWQRSRRIDGAGKAVAGSFRRDDRCLARLACRTMLSEPGNSGRPPLRNRCRALWQPSFLHLDWRIEDSRLGSDR